MIDDRNPPSPPPTPATPKSAAAMSRREFARRAALTALAPAAAAATATSAAAQSPAATPSATPAPAAQTGPPARAVQGAADANFPKLSAQSQAETDARVQSILGQYGDRLSDEQKADIRRLCAFAQPPLDRLRAYHLENADGEALYLKPLVEREKKPPAPPTTSKPAAATPPKASAATTPGAKPAAKRP